ncbi:MAG: Resolvase protein [Microgenomates group bacterium Gr01-1014_16]|nr:MAG: Resolvase protein [Microgenomates group bacterium Gr01-1014_16]
MSQKFFLYARKSTDVEDKQILSIEAQLTELRELAKKEEIRIMDELIEKRSAKIPGRPVFNSMLERIEKGEATGIISWHPDRLARNSVDGGRIIYLLDTGVIIALKFNTFWFESTPQGKFMLNIAFGQSKYYIDSLSENTKRGKRQKIRRGEYPGPAPRGYLNDLKTRTIIIDPKMAKTVGKGFALYAKGQSRIEDISQFFTKHGIISRSGLPLHKDRIKYMLTNPFYYGHFRFNGETYPGRHEPIVSKKLFDRVQEVLKIRGRPQKQATDPRPLTGLVKCGECGMMITGEVKTKHYKNTNRTAYYTYYHCTKKSKRHTCRQSPIRADDLDGQLSETIKQFYLKPDWAEWMLRKIDGEEKCSDRSVGAAVSENQVKINSLDSKLQFILDSYLDQVIDRQTYLVKKEKLMSERKTLEEQIADFSQRHHNWLEPFRDWINEAQNTPEIALSPDPAPKKSLAAKIFGSNLVLEDKKLGGEAAIVWAAQESDLAPLSYQESVLPLNQQPVG